MIKLVLGVNQFVLLKLLGQSICQTFCFLFYFGQMRLSIPKQKKSLSRYNLGLITTQESSFKLKPCLRKKMKTFFCAMDSFTLFSDPLNVKAAHLKTLITRAVRLYCNVQFSFVFVFYLKVTAQIEFILSVNHLLDSGPESRVSVEFRLEGQRFRHAPGQFRFRECWLQNIIDKKQKLIRQITL